MAQLKIVITDDHILLRDALAKLIDNFVDCFIAGVAANGSELIKLIEGGVKPDVVILDLNMPVMDGYATAKWLKQNCPEIKILVLTMFDSEVPLIRLLQTGVRGFLKKDIHPDDLRKAIITVAQDGYYYSHTLTGALSSFFHKNADGHAPFEKGILSDVEIEFLKLASTDMTYKEIAGRMNISARVIDGYRDNLFEKLDVRSRVGLAIYAVKNGIVVF